MFQIPINALKQTEGHFNELEIASTPLAHRHRTGSQFIGERHYTFFNPRNPL